MINLYDKLPKTLPGIQLIPVDEGNWTIAWDFLSDHYKYTHFPHFATLESLATWVWSSTPHFVLHTRPDDPKFTDLAAIVWWDKEDDFNKVETFHIMCHKKKNKYIQVYAVHALAYRFASTDGPEFQFLTSCRALSKTLHRLLFHHPALDHLPTCGSLLFSHLTRTWYHTSIHRTDPVLLANWLQGSHVKEETKARDAAQPANRHWFDKLRRKLKNLRHAGHWRCNP